MCTTKPYHPTTPGGRCPPQVPNSEALREAGGSKTFFGKNLWLANPANSHSIDCNPLALVISPIGYIFLKSWCHKVIKSYVSYKSSFWDCENKMEIWRGKCQKQNFLTDDPGCFGMWPSLVLHTTLNFSHFGEHSLGTFIGLFSYYFWGFPAILWEWSSHHIKKKKLLWNANTKKNRN